MRTRPRAALAALIAGIAAISLSGCFMGPLLDNRSPFDDPANASHADIARALPLIQSALDESDIADASWTVTATQGAGNCEGACELRVDVVFAPADTSTLTPIDRPDLVDNGFSRYAVPEAMLRAALEAAVPVAESQKVDVFFVSGLGPEGDMTVADLSDAVEAVFAGKEDAAGYSASFGDYSEGEVRAWTRTRTGVLAEMRLD